MADLDLRKSFLSAGVQFSLSHNFIGCSVGIRTLLPLNRLVIFVTRERILRMIRDAPEVVPQTQEKIVAQPESHSDWLTRRRESFR